MLEPYEGKLSRTVLRGESGSNTADSLDYAPLVNRLGGKALSGLQALYQPDGYKP